MKRLLPWTVLVTAIGASCIFDPRGLSSSEVASSPSSSGPGGGAATTSGAGYGGASSSTGAACDITFTCASALDGEPSMLCEGPSAELYAKYHACTCEPGGKCFAVCGDNGCKGGAMTSDCKMCIQVTAMGCAYEFEACSGDI